MGLRVMLLHEDTYTYLSYERFAFFIRPAPESFELGLNMPAMVRSWQQQRLWSTYTKQGALLYNFVTLYTGYRNHGPSSNNNFVMAP